MKIELNKTTKLSGILGLMMLLIGCSGDLLDKVPKESLTENLVWTDPAGATQFVNGIGFDRNYDWWARGLYILDGVTDIADVGPGWEHATLLQNGDFTPAYVPWGNMWPIDYGLIRKCNVALENLDRLGDDQAALKDRLKGEVYFLRGMIYHQLLRLFGTKSTGGEPTGVPLIDHSLTLDDDLQIPRATYDEVVDFIVDDLDTAASLLPSKGEIEAGRATVGAALALKSEVLLYAASPWNTGSGFDTDRLTEAAAAAQQVMDMGDYSLYPDYKEIFLTKNNDEIIFAKKFQYPDKYHQSGGGGTQNAGWDVYNSPASYRGPSDGGWGATQPTQEFVGSYDMVDGKPQTESTLYDPQKPWDNLDPRFEATVVHNGAQYRGREASLYDGGLDFQAGIFTGYWSRKFSDETLVPLYSRASDQDWIFLRYAEVLLNYAEAKNELSGPDATVYAAIDAIRARPSVQMPALPAGLSQSEMRAKIRNERKIELAFEEKRYFDIRRWGIAQDLLNGYLHKMQIIKNANGTFTYNVTTYEPPRAFPEKLYVLPIPLDETLKNTAAKQINGW